MKKIYFLLLFALILLARASSAQITQPCATDQVYRDMKQRYPRIAEYEKIQEENIRSYLRANLRNGARTTVSRNDTDYYDIPVVVHILHNYGADFIPDDKVYKMIRELNNFFDLRNDTSAIVTEFKKYVGRAKIRFHLASADPNGLPTNGITRHRSYTTYGGDDNAKMDLWPPTSYYNIWFENEIGRSAVGDVISYALLPTAATIYPYFDGVICSYLYINDGNATTASSIDHATGHYFNLYHPWYTSGVECGLACGDDYVDDTPPTKGHYSTCNLTDTACTANYFKIYHDIHGIDSLVDYPDTANTQNVMDFSYCVNMFTIGQVERMRATLNSSTGGRNNLWDPANLSAAGVGTYDTTTWTFTAFPRSDLKPIPEFSATTPAGSISRSNYQNVIQYFAFPGSTLSFRNFTWNDTVTALTWQFSNSASTPVSTSVNVVNNSFGDPGWADIKMTAHGNNSGDTTVDFPRSVFVANATGTPGLGYYQEFAQPDTAQWPMFNYYNNEFKWQIAGVGYADNSCVMYTGFDGRYDSSAGLFPATGTPRGDFDDLFSIPMDLSGFTGDCSLNFYYSGATRSVLPYNHTDTLFIDYAIGKNYSWTNLTVLAGSDLCNKGSVSGSFVPASADDWALFSYDIPAIARTTYTTFRFRYKPNTELKYDGTRYIPGIYSSGNNFYMDRMTFSPYPAGVGELHLGSADIAVAPNPTSGDAYVIAKDPGNSLVKIVVTDVTCKTVYTVDGQVASNEAQFLIPRRAISVPGLYFVHVVTGHQVYTKKLSVR
jgi:Pregnancy-associated plasma protein-A